MNTYVHAIFFRFIIFDKLKYFKETSFTLSFIVCRMLRKIMNLINFGTNCNM